MEAEVFETLPSELSSQPFIVEVFSIRETATPGYLTFHVNINYNGTEEVVDQSYNPGDTYGLGPAFAQWLIDHPDFPIDPYIPPPPPTPDELRALMPPLSRLTFRNKFKAAGMTTAVISSAIASIEDESVQEDMQIAWEDTQSFGRLEPFVIMVATFAGKTPAQIDTIWTA
jgi:hypothetical protein